MPKIKEIKTMKCPTYKAIAGYIKDKYGKNVHTCAIARVKEELGYPVKRQSENPKILPTDLERQYIKEAIENLSKVK